MTVDIPLAGVTVDGVFFPGFLLYGVPVGDDTYAEVMMEQKVKEVAEDAVRASKLLAVEPQGLWTILRLIIKFQFEYWLGLVYPSQVMAAAKGIDRVIWEVLETMAGAHIPQEEEGLGWEECLDIPVQVLGGRSLQHWLVSLPIQQGGLGIASQVEIAPLPSLAPWSKLFPSSGVRRVCVLLSGTWWGRKRRPGGHHYWPVTVGPPGSCVGATSS